MAKSQVNQHTDACEMTNWLKGIAMQRLIFKYGGWATLILVGVTVCSAIFIEQTPENYGMGEVIGYSAMLAALAMIILAQVEMKRAPEINTSYWRYCLLGLGISVLAGTGFGIYNLIYVNWVNPEFMDQYYGYYIETVRNSGQTQEQIAAIIDRLNQEKSHWQSPVIQFFGMFITVFAMGLIISVLSAGFMIQWEKKSFA